MHNASATTILLVTIGLFGCDQAPRNSASTYGKSSVEPARAYQSPSLPIEELRSAQPSNYYVPPSLVGNPPLPTAPEYPATIIAPSGPIVHMGGGNYATPQGPWINMGGGNYATPDGPVIHMGGGNYATPDGPAIHMGGGNYATPSGPVINMGGGMYATPSGPVMVIE